MQFSASVMNSYAPTIGTNSIS
uniref:Uncharacterized protein n=1 Tax=Anguilla anguilla TaxID=7936 RepID=A0A0E9PYS6_ANGAN